VFVGVALLTIAVGLIIPGMIAHSAVEVMQAARKLATGTLADFSRAMESLAAGNLENAYARVDITPVVVHTRDEVGQMAASFNTMQEEVKRAAIGLDGARDGLREARRQLEESNASLEMRVSERTAELQSTHAKLVDAAWRAGTAEVAVGVLHNVGNVLNSVNVSSTLIANRLRESRAEGLVVIANLLREHEGNLDEFLTTDEIGKQIPTLLSQLSEILTRERQETLQEIDGLARNIEHVKQIVQAQQSFASSGGMIEVFDIRDLVEDAIRINLVALNKAKVVVQRSFQQVPSLSSDKHKTLQILVNLISNAKWAVVEGGMEERIVAVAVQQVEDAGVSVEITDNGIGIDHADMPRLFEHGFTRRAGGHGFGLHSSAVAAKLMGGSLSASSEGRGHGARFVLKLPLHVKERAAV
jgi:two-component system NtrC family sensor kinase